MKISLVSVAAAFFCLAASAYSAITITSPQSGTVVTSPVLLRAATDSSRPSLISVFVNNNLVFQQNNSSIQTSIPLTRGRNTVVVRSQSGSSRYISTASVSVMVSGVATPTPTPSPTPAPDPTPQPAPQPISSPPAVQISGADQVANDMEGQNEGHPHGVPLSYDYANGPVITQGNNANGWQAITSWGVLYEAAEGNPATNSRVNIRNMQTYFLQKSTGRWLLLQNTSAPQGEAYYETFTGDYSKPADVRKESDGTISAKAGGGFNFHFYPNARATIDPNDIGGIVVVLEARLILDDPSKPDDRSTAKYLLNSGADYYPALTGSWPGNSSFNPGVGGGKFKYVQTNWRSFALSTISRSQLESNPPPVNFAGVLP